jgi:large subunit ribosomal protein L1
MPKLTKRMKKIAEGVTVEKAYLIEEAFAALKTLSTTKFVESVDVSVNLGVDPKKSDQTVRGATVLPNGTGKTVRVAAFVQGDNVKIAKDAGADLVGFEDLADAIKRGEINFDVLIATPDAMRFIGQLGQILGPKGLMPNPKVGTVTTDVKQAVTNAKAGQVRYRADKSGIVHCRIGSLEFEPAALKTNLEVLITALKKAKPITAKGVYLRKITVSSTMGPGLTVDLSSLEV